MEAFLYTFLLVSNLGLYFLLSFFENLRGFQFKIKR